MSATFHPPAELLVAYAAGSLDEARSLLVATHLTLCPTCRHDVASLESLGGGLLEEQEPAPLSHDALESILARLDETPPAPPPQAGRPAVAAMAAPMAAHDGTASPPLPRPLLAYLGDGGLDGLTWRRMGAGIESATVLETPVARAHLFRIGGGVRIPDHGHRGNELTLVLAGGFTDPSGHYKRGDVANAGSDTEHHPVADADETCLCLAVTDAPLRLTGLVGRLLNPFLKL